MRVPGFRFAGVAAGIKTKTTGRRDLGLLCMDRPAVAAGVFTQNRVRAAPVDLSIEHLHKGSSRGVVVNSGNANACTGGAGKKDALEMARAAAAAVGAAEDEICVASTGVIGVPLPMPLVRAGITAAGEVLREDGFADFAEAILTTDKGPKVHQVKVKLGTQEVTVLGCAKGAGMIAPNMATTLAFVATDAVVDRIWLRRVLREEADATFNSIIVDGDTSTNDSLFVYASGAAEMSRPIREDDRDGKKLRAALHEVLDVLARMIVRDGEGATKLVHVRVTGADSERSARAVARKIATSPLVKTAICGADPNWGRILAAVGNAGVVVDPDAIEISLDDVLVVKRGAGVVGKDLDARAHAVMTRNEYEIRVDLGMGRARGHATTCDLTHEYITINASYRT